MGLLTVYKLKLNEMRVKKTKSFCSRDCKTLVFEKISFVSSLSKYMIALTSKPEYKLTLWDWEKGKLKAIIDINGFIQINGLYLMSE